MSKISNKNILFKGTSFVLIWAFLLLDASWAANGDLKMQYLSAGRQAQSEHSTLAPKLQIEDLALVFQICEKLSQAIALLDQGQNAAAKDLIDQIKTTIPQVAEITIFQNSVLITINGQQLCAYKQALPQGLELLSAPMLIGQMQLAAIKQNKITTGEASSLLDERFEEIIKRLEDKLTENEQKLLRQVFQQLKAIYYKDKKVPTGALLIEHALGLLEKLTPLDVGINTYLAGLTHCMEIIEDDAGGYLYKTELDLDKAIKELLAESMHLANGDTRLADISDIARKVKLMNKTSQLPYLPPSRGDYIIQKQMNAIIALTEGDFDVMQLVFACVLQTIEEVNPEDEKTCEYVKRLVLDLYAPLAERLRLDDLSHELRAQAFRLRYPEIHDRIKAQTEALIGSYEDVYDELVKLQQEIITGLGVAGISEDDVIITFRIKTPHSIYEKLKLKTGRDIPQDDAELRELIQDNIRDLIGIRIVYKKDSDFAYASNIPEYLYGPDALIGTRAKYEAVNGYTALYEKMIDERGRLIDFQIMSIDDYKKFNQGIAAHWRYKLMAQTQQSFDPDPVEITGDPNTNYENLYAYFSEHFVYAFSEEGEFLRPLRLDKGATIADFAAMRRVNKFAVLLTPQRKITVLDGAAYDLGKKAIRYAKDIKCTVSATVKNGQVVRVGTGGRESGMSVDKTLSTIRNTCIHLRTKLHANKPYSSQMQEAKRAGEAKLKLAGFDLKNKRHREFFNYLAEKYDFLDVDELIAFIGADIETAEFNIDIIYLEFARHFLNIRVNPESISSEGKPRYRLEITGETEKMLLKVVNSVLRKVGIRLIGDVELKTSTKRNAIAGALIEIDEDRKITELLKQFGRESIAPKRLSYAELTVMTERDDIDIIAEVQKLLIAGNFDVSITDIVEVSEKEIVFAVVMPKEAIDALEAAMNKIEGVAAEIEVKDDANNGNDWLQRTLRTGMQAGFAFGLDKYLASNDTTHAVIKHNLNTGNTASFTNNPIITWALVAAGILIVGGVILWLVIQNHKLKKENVRLKETVGIDHLTGLPNRQRFNTHLVQELNRAKRYSPNLSLIIVDIDDFKQINDTLGHNAGDRVLRDLAGLMKLRDTDIVARWGGEEFIIILPETDYLGAERAAEELRQRIAEQLKIESQTVTISLGVLTLTPEDIYVAYGNREIGFEDLEWAVEKADRALYFSKENGKNRATNFSVVNVIDQYNAWERNLASETQETLDLHRAREQLITLIGNENNGLRGSPEDIETILQHTLRKHFPDTTIQAEDLIKELEERNSLPNDGESDIISEYRGEPLKVDYIHIPQEDIIPAQDSSKVQQSLDAQITAMQQKIDSEEKVPDELMLGWKGWPYRMTEELKDTLAAAGEVREEGLTDVIFIGIGGSSAPLEAMLDLLYPDYKAEGWNNSNDRTGPRIHVLDTTDEVKVKLMMNIVQNPNNKTKICVISKSGETLEPDVGFRMLKGALGKDYAQHVMVITDKAKGTLRTEAQTQGYKIVGIVPDEIGGRYSAFTAVGMFALALTGADISRIAQGAADLETSLKKAGPQANVAIGIGYLMARYSSLGMDTIIWAYGTERFLGEKTFLEQKQAESLGKKRNSDGRGVGPTPMMVLCDGISQPAMENLALTQRHLNISLLVTNTGDANLDRRLRLECEQREEKLKAKGYPILRIEIPRMDEYYLGQLYQLIWNNIAYAGEFLDVYTFNQPGVQTMKNFVNVVLGKDTTSEKAAGFRTQLVEMFQTERESAGQLSGTVIEQITQELEANISGHAERDSLFIDLTNVLERAIKEYGVPEKELAYIRARAEKIARAMPADKKQGLSATEVEMAVYMAGIIQYLETNKGYKNLVGWIYGEDLADFGRQLVKLRAQELPASLAPLVVMSPQGQHSVQQMMLEGANKYINLVIMINDHGEGLSVPDLGDGSYLAGKELDYIINAEAVCTSAAMTANSRPNITIMLSNKDDITKLSRFMALEMAAEQAFQNTVNTPVQQQRRKISDAGIAVDEAMGYLTLDIEDERAWLMELANLWGLNQLKAVEIMSQCANLEDFFAMQDDRLERFKAFVAAVKPYIERFGARYVMDVFLDYSEDPAYLCNAMHYFCDYQHLITLEGNRDFAKVMGAVYAILGAIHYHTKERFYKAEDEEEDILYYQAIKRQEAVLSGISGYINSIEMLEKVLEFVDGNRELTYQDIGSYLGIEISAEVLDTLSMLDAELDASLMQNLPDIVRQHIAAYPEQAAYGLELAQLAKCLGVDDEGVSKIISEHVQIDKNYVVRVIREDFSWIVNTVMPFVENFGAAYVFGVLIERAKPITFSEDDKYMPQALDFLGHYSHLVEEKEDLAVVLKLLEDIIENIKTNAYQVYELGEDELTPIRSQLLELNLMHAQIKNISGLAAVLRVVEQGNGLINDGDEVVAVRLLGVIESVTMQEELVEDVAVQTAI